ncbi:A disintegrin and metalloproteinase with thrombospondin motifs adt-1-like [Ruditapes philippinarum]|uniref:A disintegrin and metalloproteinase with thrombospondin motifs adt-1-like n=1 Tax=Ruditapes philippinarum TaxID=129788 RepID=UPI00295A8E9B|nr:A disintegrin and metalloproteinase with thrombospondin motifs adt-1-like [Ruditapes philippinarum]
MFNMSKLFCKILTFTAKCTILLGLCFVYAESFLNPAVAQWGEWGSEQCSIVAGRCILSRSRNCSAQNMQECIVRGGNEYTVNVWTDMTTCRCRIEESTTSSTTLVPSTTPSSHWLEWGTWECHLMSGECTQLRWRKCSGSRNECKGSDYSLKHCDGLICRDLQGTSTSMPTTLSITSSSVVTTYSFTNTQSLRSSRATMSSTNLQYFMSSTSSSIYWLEWSDWDCKNIPICLMSRTRNCSNYEPNDCERKLLGSHYEIQPCRGEICPYITTIGTTAIAVWSNWGPWECHYEQGLCVMSRYRTCLDNKASHHCPGQDYELRSCGNTCSDVTTTGSPVTALWSNWSSWECNHDEQGLCVMTRYRTCLYNKTGKRCHGEDFELRSCGNACSG